MEPIKMDRPTYHQLYLKHEVKTFGEKRLVFSSKIYKEYETFIWRECSCGDVWDASCNRSYD